MSKFVTSNAPFTLPNTATVATQKANPTQGTSVVNFTPTAQQQAFIDTFHEGKNIVGQAVAGSGKTSTLMLIDKELSDVNKRGYYLAFNRSIAQEVQSKFTNIEARTFHSVAMQLVRRSPQAPLLDKLHSPKAITRYGQAAKALGLNETTTYLQTRTFSIDDAAIYIRQVNTDPKLSAALSMALIKHQEQDDVTDNDVITVTLPKFVSAAAIFGEAIRAIDSWCQSDEDEFTDGYVELPSLIDPSSVDDYTATIAKAAKFIWDNDICNPKGKYTFKHDYYLKIASLQHPDFTQGLNMRPGDVIMFDEAQDARPCMAKMVEDQMKHGLQIITVGDSNQAIYQSFTGARDALPRFSAMDNTEKLTLTTSWRFGEQLADWANTVLPIIEKNPLIVQGNPDKTTNVYTYSSKPPTKETRLYNLNRDAKMPDTQYVISPDHVDAYLVRSNAELIEVAERMLMQGIPYRLETDTREIERSIEAFEAIRSNRRTNTAVFREFTDFVDMINYTQDPYTKDSQLARLIANIHLIGPNEVRQVMNHSQNSHNAKVTISTAHKAKGLEWDNVAIYGNESTFLPGFALHDSFDELFNKDTHTFEFEEHKEAFMLLYVSLTRAKKNLYIPERIVDGINAWKTYIES